MKAENLQPSPQINGFSGDHCHWWNGSCSTIGTNGFSMVFWSVNHWWRWFSMVANHWSNDAMVTIHRSSLSYIYLGHHHVESSCRNKLDRSDVSLPSHRWTNGWQPLKNIVTNGWLTEKPSKNHWSQWLSRYHSINGNGHLRNHWFVAMVVDFLWNKSLNLHLSLFLIVRNFSL